MRLGISHGFKVESKSCPKFTKVGSSSVQDKREAGHAYNGTFASNWSYRVDLAVISEISTGRDTQHAEAGLRPDSHQRLHIMQIAYFIGLLRNIGLSLEGFPISLQEDKPWVARCRGQPQA